MPKRKRIQHEHTEDWQTIQQYTLWPEQAAYELLRPIVLYTYLGLTATDCHLVAQSVGISIGYAHTGKDHRNFLVVVPCTSSGEISFSEGIAAHQLEEGRPYAF